MQNENSENPSQTLFAWSAPLRSYHPASGSVLRFCIAVASLLSALAWIFSDKILILPILAVVFVFYVLTTSKPPIVKHEITKFGLSFAGFHTRFESLSYYYFLKKYSFYVLVVVGQPPSSHHTYFVIDTEENKQNIDRILSEHLVKQSEPLPNISDKLGNWLTTLIPDENIN